MRNNKANEFKKMLLMIMVAPVVLSLSLFAANPVNHWKLDEIAGSTYVDSLGGADGTCTEPGCPTPISGIVNGAQDFNGTETDMITVPDTAGFDWGTDANVTIEFWMKSGALQEISDNDVIMGRTDGNIKWYIGMDGATAAKLGHVRAYIIDGVGGPVSGNIAVNNDEWNHIAFVLNTDMVKVYVNGEYDFNITRTATDLSLFDTNVTIGTLDTGGGDWAYTGQLDDIKLYATDLNGSTIKENYMNVVNPDITAPTLAEVTAVPTPTDDNTPDYTFSSDEAGTITYGGSCSSTTTTALAGNNTITFNALADGVYNDCTITVTDAAANPSTPLDVTEFVVDTTVPDVIAPILAEVTAVPTPTDDNTPDYTFSSDEAGTITYGGECNSPTALALAGNNTITFNALVDGVYSDCTITVTDAAANPSTPLAVTEFVVDTTVPDVIAPTVAEVTAVTTPTSDTTPNYIFSSDEAGTITYGGSCSSTTTTATAGFNVISFNALADGVYSDCTITVTDAASNTSDPLAVTEFVVDTTGGSTGGGGCTYNPNSKNFDMTFLLMMALGLFYPFRRRFMQ